VFRLIVPPKTKAELTPFYLLENKVSFEQFQAVRGDPQMEMEKWLQHYEGRGHPVRRAWKKPGWLVAGHENWPVTNVTAVEAYCFARCLGGRLPRPEEWDAAGGRFDGCEGPYNEEWHNDASGRHGIAIQLTRGTFRPVGQSEMDESKCFCRDMAGNGYEWLDCVLLQIGTDEVPMKEPDPMALVERRGQSPRAAEPLRFKMVENGEMTSRPYAGDDYHETSFRVVYRPSWLGGAGR
jgi:hypothetical protein